MSINLAIAIEFAVQKHGNQRDKGGNTYIRHPLRVMERMDSEDEMIVAVLHDVVEDTDATLEDLKGLGCTEAQIMAIDALTKKEGQTEAEYLNEVRKSVVARKVKRADIEDNMDLWRMKNKDTGLGEKDMARINKYLRMYRELGG